MINKFNNHCFAVTTSKRKMWRVIVHDLKMFTYYGVPSIVIIDVECMVCLPYLCGCKGHKQACYFMEEVRIDQMVVLLTEWDALGRAEKQLRT